MRRRALGAATMGLALAAACGKGQGQPAAGDKAVIVASIFPLYDLVRSVGGDRIQVELLLPAGQSEHDYEPSAKLAKTVSQARAAFLVGLALDDWGKKTIEASAKGARIVALGDAVKAKTFRVDRVGGHDHEQDHEHEHEEEHAHPSGPDPHVWLSVPNAVAMVDAIAKELGATLPADTALFTSHASELKKRLEALDADIRKGVKGLSNKRLVTFHGSFGYFAAEYGLEIAAVIEPFPGKQPSAAYLKEVLEVVKAKKPAALFAEPQLDRRPAEVLAKEAGLPLRELDPIGGTSGRESYDALMRFNLKALAETMK